MILHGTRPINIQTITNSVFQSKSYVLSSNNYEEAWIVDCGDPEPLIKYLTINKLDLKGILITHTHFDHIYGLNDLATHFPDTSIYTSAEGAKGLYDENRNLSKFNEKPWCFKFKNVIDLTEDSKLDVLGRNVRIYSTPGHDISCLSFNIGNFLFTGDTYIPGIKTFTKWPLSNKYMTQKSQERIIELVKNENLKIMAGH